MTLSGGNVDVSVEAGNYGKTKLFKIQDSSNAINGRFTSATDNPANHSSVLDYDRDPTEKNTFVSVRASLPGPTTPRTCTRSHRGARQAEMTCCSILLQDAQSFSWPGWSVIPMRSICTMCT